MQWAQYRTILIKCFIERLKIIRHLYHVMEPLKFQRCTVFTKSVADKHILILFSGKHCGLNLRSNYVFRRGFSVGLKHRCLCYVWLSFLWWTWRYVSVQMCMLCMAVIIMMAMTVYICTDVYVMYDYHSYGGHDCIYLYRCVCYVWLSFSWWKWWYISVQMCMLCMAVILMVDMTVCICTDVYVMYGCHSHGGHDGIYLYRCVCYVWLSFSWWIWRYISVQM